VSISWSKSVSCWVSSSSSNISPQGRAVYHKVYPAVKLMISEGWPPEVLPVGAGVVPGGGGFGSGVHIPSRGGSGSPVPLPLQHVCRFFALPFWRGRQPDVWFWRSIARCHCIAACTLLYWGNVTPCFFFSRTWGCGFLMRYFVSSIVAREKPYLGILAIFNARRMSDCSSCTWPSCLALVADMWKTYKTLVAPCHNEIWLLPLPYMLR